MTERANYGPPWSSRWVLAIAWVVPVGCCVAFALGPVRTLRWLLTGSIVYVVALCAALTALETAVILELVRSATPTSDHWTRATYWRVIAALWPALFALLLVAGFLMRRRLS
jgi:hypothetical protein